MALDPAHRLRLYGAFAFACLVLACFSEFITARQLGSSELRLALTFVLGILYVVLFIGGSVFCDHRSLRHDTVVFLLNCATLTALIFVSPVRWGSFDLIVLPLFAYAILRFDWRWAVLAGLYIYGAVFGVFWYYHSLPVATEATRSLFTAFAFVGVFSVVAKQALQARQHSEQLSRELQEANQQLRDHASQTEELATTQERNRLAREIHDGVGHYLTVVKVQLDAAAALLPTQPAKAQASLEQAARLAGEALDDVRRSVGALRTDATRPPLVDALRQLAASAAPPPAFTITGTPRSLATAVEHALYRCTQEGLTNLRRHAGATEAQLTLDFRDPARVTLALRDNGRGAASTPNESAPAGTGHGLRGLQERIALLGGTVTAANRPEGGFALVVEVPA